MKVVLVGRGIYAKQAPQGLPKPRFKTAVVGCPTARACVRRLSVSAGKRLQRPPAMHGARSTTPAGSPVPAMPVGPIPRGVSQAPLMIVNVTQTHELLIAGTGVMAWDVKIARCAPSHLHITNFVIQTCPAVPLHTAGALSRLLREAPLAGDGCLHPTPVGLQPLKRLLVLQATTAQRPLIVCGGVHERSARLGRCPERPVGSLAIDGALPRLQGLVRPRGLGRLLDDGGLRRLGLIFHHDGPLGGRRLDDCASLLLGHHTLSLDCLTARHKSIAYDVNYTSQGVARTSSRHAAHRWILELANRNASLERRSAIGRAHPSTRGRSSAAGGYHRRQLATAG